MLLLCGCSRSNQKELENKYYIYVKDTQECIYFSDIEYDFDLQITLEKLNDDYLIYRLYIDHPKDDIYDVEALITHDFKTEDVFPSSGLYEEPLSLYKNAESEDYIKGIILSGYIETNKEIKDLDITFKTLIRAKNRLGYYKEYCYEKDYNSKEDVILK